MRILKNIDDVLKSSICKAKDIDIAVAMMTQHGFDLLSKANKDCSVRIVVGTDLPTPTEILRQLRKKYKKNARHYVSNNTFHPKVYLFKFSDGSRRAIIGSANFTENGCLNNIELSVELDSDQCLGLKTWFEEIFKSSESITEDFLQRYKPYDIKWHHDKKENAKILRDIKTSDIETNHKRDKIRNELIELRKSHDCKRLERERTETINQLLEAIDINHDFREFDVETFLKQEELGHILSFNKKSLIKSSKNGSLRRLCRMLWTKHSTSVLFDNALDPSKYKVFGVGRNIVSKLLVLKDKHKYFLWNKPTDNFIKAYGIRFEHGTSNGEKYEQLCDLFQQLCQETGISDMAVLDALLYIWNQTQYK